VAHSIEGASVLIVTWNLAGRVKRLDEQARMLLALDADLICLQETSASTLPLWQELLQAAGYLGLDHGELHATEERIRPLAVLTAARAPLQRLPVADVPWPERVLAVRTAGDVEVVNVHSPTSPKPALAKVRTHRAVYRHLASGATRPRILCGDLNTPRKELADGSVWTFARDRYGRLRADRGADWEQAELSLIRGLEPFGFRDAFRELHGWEEPAFSWEWPRWGGGYRLDHLFVAGFDVESCLYEHRWRREGLSDHSPLIAQLKPGARAD
jgi:exodeoxyribonuclease-3